MSNDSSKKAQKKWVLRSTDASIAAGQYSVLAVCETLFVLVLYSWLAYHFEYQWWLYLAAMAAPLILLRSEASVERGLELLESYSNSDEDDVSTIEKRAIIGIATLVSFAISSYLAIIWLTGPEYWGLLFDYLDWGLFWRLAIIGSITIVFAIAFWSVFAGKGANTADALAAMIINGDNDKLLNMIIFIIISPLIIPIFLGISLAVWLHSLWIRTIAKLQHPMQGLHQLPINLRDVLWKIDFTQAPELLPKAKQVDKFFSVNGLIATGKGDNSIVSISFIFMAVSWYIPALLWRWSLKATLWLWWPIAFILRSPFEGKTLANMRDITAWRVNGLSKWLVVLPVAVMAWLLLANFPQLEIPEGLLQGQAKTLFEQIKNLTVPDMGLRQVMLWLCCSIMLVIWYFSQRLATIHKGILEDETILKDLDKKAKARFTKRVEHLDRLLTIRVVAFIFLGYSYLLYFAYQHYPNDVAHFIPAGLIPYL